ncbi:sigma-70 family RNA polymerase sigma factor [Nonomuraea typhae]|uniref:Sigma-70 family RNA polymerase sigma factor n=1 Tax=Nonomuraea typhae TaxID=2603600 RepID=A0ABW7YKB5_9ACTN
MIRHPSSVAPPREAPPSFAELFAAQYHPLVRLAGLLGADDPEDIAQEAFSRLHARRLRDDRAAVAYLRAIVCNLTRNRLRHLRLVRLRRPEPPEPARSGEQAVLIAEEHRELLAALDRLPRRQREALVLRYWLDLSEREIAAAMGVSTGSVKTHASRGLAALAKALKEDA